MVARKIVRGRCGDRLRGHFSGAIAAQEYQTSVAQRDGAGHGYANLLMIGQQLFGSVGIGQAHPFHLFGNGQSFGELFDAVYQVLPHRFNRLGFIDDCGDGF